MTGIIAVAVSLLLTGSLNAAEIKPLQVLSWAEYQDLTDREKDLYLTGLVEGQSFMLYGASHPDLETFVRCIEDAGVTRIRKMTETIFMLHPDELNFPIPWSVSRALGIVCAPERRDTGHIVKENERTREYQVNSVRVISNSAVMRYQKDYFATVMSGIVGSEGIPEIISLGDMIEVNDERLTANIIFVTEYKVDFEWAGEVYAKKGDISCLIVENEKDIPSDDEQDRLWITVKHCQPLR